MSVYQDRSLLARQIAEKRKLLREIYGGMMSPAQLDREIGRKRKGAGEAWARMVGLEYVMVSKSRRGYETDKVAEALVRRRVPA